jgi:hypothetical protein
VGNAPVFGRRGTTQIERPLVRLADLPPDESNLDDDDLAAWKHARKQTLNETRRRWLYGWGGLGTLCALGAALMRHFDLDLVALLLSAAGMFCVYRAYRASRG